MSSLRRRCRHACPVRRRSSRTRKHGEPAEGDHDAALSLLGQGRQGSCRVRELLQVPLELLDAAALDRERLRAPSSCEKDNREDLCLTAAARGWLRLRRACRRGGDRTGKARTLRAGTPGARQAGKQARTASSDLSHNFRDLACSSGVRGALGAAALAGASAMPMPPAPPSLARFRGMSPATWLQNMDIRTFGTRGRRSLSTSRCRLGKRRAPYRAYLEPRQLRKLAQSADVVIDTEGACHCALKRRVAPRRSRSDEQRAPSMAHAPHSSVHP